MLADKDSCTGCGVCVVACKKKLIRIECDECGYYYPRIVGSDECSSCGLCEKVCPCNDQDRGIDDSYNVKGYSYISKEDSVKRSTSSGGFSYDLGELMISKGYCVCGVRYNERQERAEHFICENIEELLETKGSKYIQSFTVDALEKIFYKNKVIFFGSPCQVAAFKLLLQNLNKEKIDVVLVDFFCHGVPSYYLWKYYLKNQKNKYNTDELKKIRFRDKDNGWGEFLISFFVKNEIKIKDKNSIFYAVYFSNLVLRKSCYNCHYKGVKSSADIRMGDYWGRIEDFDDKGASCVLCYSEKGENIISKLGQKTGIIEYEKISDVLEGQMVDNIAISKKRLSLLMDLKSGKSELYIIFRYVLSTYLKGMVSSKFKRKVKRIFK